MRKRSWMEWRVVSVDPEQNTNFRPFKFKWQAKEAKKLSCGRSPEWRVIKVKVTEQ